MTWVTFEVAGGGLVALQRQHVVAIYDEQGVVKLSTTASGVHILKDTTVQHAAMKLIEAAEAAPRLPREPAPSTPSCLATRSQ
jgi:hypothetical protein